MTELADRTAIARPAAQEDADTRIARLYEAEIGRLTALGHLLTGDQSAAEDLAQEVFIDLLQELREDPDYLQGPPWGWLRTAMVHRAANHKRFGRRELARLMRIYQEPHPEDEWWSESTVDFQRAVSTLPPRMRACFVLAYCEDLTLEHIADTLGCGVRTVETQLRRARPRVAELLGIELSENRGHRSGKGLP